MRCLRAALLGVFGLLAAVLGPALLGGAPSAFAVDSTAASTVAETCGSGPVDDYAGRALTPDDFARTGKTWSVTVDDDEFTFLRLDCADLRGASLHGFHLTELSLTGADLTGADLSGNEIDRVLLDHTDLSDANLSGMNFAQIRFGSSSILRTDFSGADLGQASFAGMDLVGSTFAGADLSQADLTNTGLAGVDLSSADLSQAQLDGADLTRTLLRGADFSQASMAGSDLTGAHASAAKITQVIDLDGVSFRGTDLRHAVLTQSRLTNADLREVDLTGADLSQTELAGADLTGATIAGADWTQAMVSGVATGNRLLGQFPLDAVVLAFVLAIAVFVLLPQLRANRGVIPALMVLAIIGGALIWQIVATTAYPEALRPLMFLTLIGPLVFICVFVGFFVRLVQENADPDWRSASSLLVLLAGIHVLLATVMAWLQHPILGGEAFQSACTATTCLGGFARGFHGVLFGGLLVLLGMFLLTKLSRAPQQHRQKDMPTAAALSESGSGASA